MKGILIFLAIIVLTQAFSFDGTHRRRHVPSHTEKDGIDLGDFAKVAKQLREHAGLERVVQQAKEILTDVMEESPLSHQEEKGMQNDGEKSYSDKTRPEEEGETRHHCGHGDRKGCHSKHHKDREGKEEQEQKGEDSFRHHRKQGEAHIKGEEHAYQHDEEKGEEGHEEGWRHHDGEGSRHHQRHRGWGHHSRWGRHHDKEEKGHEGWTHEDRKNFHHTFTTFKLESGLPSQTYNILSDQGIQVHAVYGDCVGENRTVVQKVAAKVGEKTIVIDQSGSLEIDGSKYDVDGKFSMTYGEGAEVKVLHRGAILIKQGPYRIFVKPKSHSCASLRTSISVAKNATVTPTGYLGQRMAVNPKDHVVAM